MTWILGALVLLLLMDVARMRGRIRALATLPPSTAPVDAAHRFITAPGVELDEATCRAASAWACAHGLDVVDLIPRDLPAMRAMSLALRIDPRSYRRARFGVGHTAGHALLVSAEVVERARVDVTELRPVSPVVQGASRTSPFVWAATDEVGLFRIAARLKLYANGSADMALAPAERAVAQHPKQHLGALRTMLGFAFVAMFAAQPTFWIVLGLGVWLRPLWGGIAVGIWHLQPLLAIAGTPVRSRDLLIATVCRGPREIALFVRIGLAACAPAGDLVTGRRLEYAALLAGGTARFFEPRRESCPVCAALDLAVYSRSHDIILHKPGRFTLERCRTCGHIFQNPRLSLAGLEFYYKDFYDGRGETDMELAFSSGIERYRARARFVLGAAPRPPARWLDVGGGHGHFCCAARDELPATRFDGLDLSESIDEAKRRGWVDHAYRGLFPDIAPSIAGRYDTVSMSHYLEHTLDPRRELAAAHLALAAGGSLFIEVPDPEFRLGRMLGRLWLPWFQPQHLHLLSAANLERLLREHGFTPVAWHRGDAHQRNDLCFAAWILLDRIAPSPHLPWRWGGSVAQVRRAVVWTLGVPLILGGVLADRVLDPFFRRAKHSNAYRVLARRDG